MRLRSLPPMNSRVLRGRKNPRAILSDQKVREIRASDEPNTVLAKRYGCSDTVIGSIKRRESWRHVK